MEESFIKISGALADADYKKSLKLVDGVLEHSKHDQDARKVKLFCFIMIGRYEDALELIKSNQALKSHCSFEHAYCFYKLGQLDASLELLQGAEDIGSQQLKAMVHMRAGNTREASSVYRALAPKLVTDKQSAIELATNTIAALVLSSQHGQISSALQQLRVRDRDSLEVALNMACAAVVDGELDTAQKLLQLAETKGNETLIEENASQAEMDEELGPVHAQSAYIASLRGDTATAAKVYTTLLNQSAGTALHAVCSNNITCMRALQADGVPKEAKRKLAAFIDAPSGMVTAALARRLPQAAQASLRHNYALAGLLGAVSGGGSGGSSTAGNATSICSASASLLDAAPDSEDALLLHAAATGLLQGAERGIKVVDGWLQAHTDADATRAVLMGAHIAASAQMPKLDVVLAYLGHPRLPQVVSRAPAVLATRACLRERLSMPQAAEASADELQAAVEWWGAQPAGPHRAEALAACLEWQAAVLLRLGQRQAALKSLRALQAEMGQRWAAERVRMARMLVTVDPAAATDFASGASASRAAHAVNAKEAEDLEVSGILSKGTSVLLGPYVRGAAGAGTGGRPGRKRKRKPRYPQGFDPENPGPPPDPERWLPWHERAANKKRRKRKGGNQPVSKGAQGMGAVDETLDKSHITTEDLDAKAKPSNGPKVPPRNTKGKRKGKR